MEAIIEFVLEIVAQFLLELVFGGISEGVHRASRTKVGRIVLWLCFSAVPAAALGYLWGVHVRDIGQKTQPISMWISVAVAIALIVLADRIRDPLAPKGERLAALAKVTPRRLRLLAITNLLAAAGIGAGFNRWF